MSAAATTAVPTSAPLKPNDVAQVVTTDLVVRSAPGGGADSEIYPGALAAPTLLFVVDGPVTASGYDWYLVDPFTMDNSQPPVDWRLGWVAAGSRDGTEAWIGPAAPNCPAPDVDALIALSPIAALACYGDRPLTLDGSFGGFSSVVPGVIQPYWLGVTVHMLRPPDTPPDAPLTGPTLYFHVPGDQPFDPRTLDFEVGTAVRVVGHFDDPAAQTCVAGPLPGPQPTPGSLADEILADKAVVLFCRGLLVVIEASPQPVGP